MPRCFGCSSPARVLVAATLIYYGATSTGGRPDQTYTPPRMKDGRIEPGQLK